MSKNIEQNQGISQASTQKKISFFSAILVVMGSSIGAGIFFKSKGVLDHSQNSLVLAIFCWIIAAFSVVAMALALVEISSARNDNLSLLGWTKVFNSRTTFKASKNFMFYIYLPLTYFFMPLYVILSLQDGLGALTHSTSEILNAGENIPFSFGTKVDWLLWTFISIAISVYFIYASGISSRIGDIQNKIVTYIKFLPLALVAIIGFILIGLNAGGWSAVSATVQKPTLDDGTPDSLAMGASLSSFAPGFGMFLAVSAIFFAFDGFYVAAGIQSEMKEPKKTPMAILLGLVATTVIYLIIAISMSINGGSFAKMAIFLAKEFGDAGRILFGIINIMIAIGVLGIINGFSMWAPRFTEDLIKEGELPFSIKYKNRLNENKPIIGIIYSFVITGPIVLLFTLIGSLAYIDSYTFVSNNVLITYGTGMGKLYTFADLMGTWTALFTFGFIMSSIYGGLKNRKTNKVITDKKTYFVPMAWITVVMVGISVALTVLMPIFDLFLISQLNKELVEAAGRNYLDIVVGRIMIVITLMIFLGLSYGTTVVEDFLNTRKYGSIENYEQWQRSNFIVS